MDKDYAVRAGSEELICLCGGHDFETTFIYNAPPRGENRFPVNEGGYRRVVLRCRNCNHYLSRHVMNLDALYAHDYVTSVYGGGDGIQQAYERICKLPPERSDNAGRVARVTGFACEYFESEISIGRSLTVLDVGSGLCVFLKGMKEAGFDCTALDPDPRFSRHAALTVGVNTICDDFFRVESTKRYDLVTFNKVLEHVFDPVAMLSKSIDFVRLGGLVYIELPDGEEAANEGPGREEFFIEHHHVFSAASLAIMATRASFRILSLERLREPSSKFTLRAFLSPVIKTP